MTKQNMQQSKALELLKQLIGEWVVGIAMKDIQTVRFFLDVEL